MDCPLCEGERLKETSVSGMVVDACARCGGIWLGAGKLESLPERPSARVFQPLTRHAPGRCRRNGHPISRALVRCPACGGLPAECPACKARLAMVPTPACAIDICPRCEGVWLDKGELESLRRLQSAPTSVHASAGSLRGWEVPPPSGMGKDPWLGPGQVQAIAPNEQVLNLRAPFSCRHCASSLSVGEAWAFDGEIYCSACRPQGAVSGHQLPRDVHPGDEPIAYDSHNGWGFRLLRSIIELMTGGS